MRLAEILSFHALNVSGSFSLDELVYLRDSGALPPKTCVMGWGDPGGYNWVGTGTEMTNTLHSKPYVVLEQPTNVESISPANDKSFGVSAIKYSDGRTLTAGYYSYGLIDRSASGWNNFAQTTNTWSKYTSGYMWVAGLKSDGTLWTWGNSGNYRTGLNSTSTFSSATQNGTDTDWSDVQCGYDFGAAMKTDGSVWFWGYNQYGPFANTGSTTVPTKISEDTYLSMSVGTRQMAFIRNDTTLWMCGSEYGGALGNGNATYNTQPLHQVGTDTDWAEVKVGYNIVMAKKTDGTLWSWGYNGYGEAGQPIAQVNVSYPTQIQGSWKDYAPGSSASLLVSSDNALFAAGRGLYLFEPTVTKIEMKRICGVPNGTRVFAGSTPGYFVVFQE